MEFTNATRRVFQTRLTFAGTPERVFPLLCPVREYDWIEDWSCVMVYSDSGVAELGCVFRTNRVTGDDEVWTVSRYEPGRAIGFVRVIPEFWVAKMDIELHPDAAGTAPALVTHSYTALGARGGAYLEAMVEESHSASVRGLETMANHYLTTGQMLRSTPPTGT